MHVHGVDEIDRALEEFDAMELFQAKEMVRHAASGRAAEHEALEWQGHHVMFEDRSKAAGYWGDCEWYLRGPSGDDDPW